MIFFFGMITFCYLITMLLLWIGFGKLPYFFEKPVAPETTFSIVIPYRNEAENIPNLLSSLASLKYPTAFFEIILVNDASEDTSEELCMEFKQNHSGLNVQIRTSERKTASPKKDAITTAIAHAHCNYILTTDADCTVPENWLVELDTFIQKTQTKFIAGPVRISSELSKKGSEHSLLHYFQELDVISLQAATMGGFGLNKAFLCNGANLCYEKKSFLKLDGFKGNGGIASGDDVFLLEKFEKAGIKSGFLKSRNTLVSTTPQPNLKMLISQRKRWAAKTSAYKNPVGKWIGILVFLMNFGLVLSFFLMILGLFPLQTLFFFFLLKFNMDLLLLYSGLEFFQREQLLKHYFWSSFLYPFFSSYVALASLFSGYIWKDRSFKK